ncbi:N-6 DNA methylase [Halococcus sp. IIIV-5B]|uniref:N-6 DNA methylase n=1 Tax=Halococcus sp. IIIV-5B TaxID=2321230 RepID=UPI000E7203FF|nr:N-6 DNA methylase [Halococcus sp. IIIV-5B]RJT04760.1 SAM-dependent DNA methyltransferase [Halococcus sp. IIIV-5B]
MSEADVHFELYRHLQNAIEANPDRDGVTFGTARPEYGENMEGFADIVIFDENGDSVFVVEAKKPGEPGNRSIDPYSPDVIQQAFGYAGQLGAGYFCTFNGQRLVMFNAFERGQTLLERSTKSYEGITDLAEFADFLLDQVAEMERGEGEWDALDAAFIERVRSLHEFVAPAMSRNLRERLNEDEHLRSRFSEWTDDQGLEYTAEDTDDAERRHIEREFAAQAAYLLINKIIFYRILESSSAYGDEVEPLAISIRRVKDDLEDYFDLIVEEIDFEAVFTHDEIFDEIPLNGADSRIRNFVIELEDQDLSHETDIAGTLYQEVIPESRRHSMGEYYTPPEVTDLITRLTIDEPTDYVFDPACGSGGFLISAYHRLDEMDGFDHADILSQIGGVDINRFPAHLSAINLTVQDLESYTNEVNIEVSDFFDTRPNDTRLGRQAASTEGSSQEFADEGSEGGLQVIDELGGVDALIGNPPYIRSSNIANTDSIREHLTNVGVEADYLPENSDIYAYFLTHGTEFLADDGRLGFITSDSWLQVRFGESVQQFLLDNYEIEAVVKFDRQVFDDALVGSCVTILQKQEDAESRDSNVVKFLRIKEEMDIPDIVDLIEADEEPDQMIRTDMYRLVTREQAVLYDEPKWSIFFLAPPTYFEIVDTDVSTPFENLADQHRANTSGKNTFFHVREDVEELGIGEYLSPLAKASGQIDRIPFTESDAEEWGILDVHDLVVEALNDTSVEFGEGNEERVKKWLRENGHTDLLEYIEWGEDRKMHTGDTCQSRDVWFDLQDLDRTKILIPRFTWRVFRVIWNEAMSCANDQFYNVHPKEGIDEKALCGVLNSRLIWMFYELQGRTVGGEGMNRTEIKGYEIDDLPIPDIRSMSEEEVQEIADAFDALINREKEIGTEVEPEDCESERNRLDRAVLNACGLGDRVDEIRHAVEGLVAIRESGGGVNTEVLVERTTGSDEEPEVIDLPGVSEVRESTTLGDF